jgi:predicted nucleotidyltransferase
MTGTTVDQTELDALLASKRDEILRVAARYGATDVRLFGSAARGEAGDESDVDFLVRMEPGRSVFDLAALMDELKTLLGRPVDVVPDDNIYWLLRRRILKEAQPL